MHAIDANRRRPMTGWMAASARALGIAACFAWAAAFPARAAAADAYPDRPIRIVIGTPAGSALDFLLRTMAEKLRAELGAPIVIESRTGADMIVAARLVATSPPDGYTLLGATRTHFVVNPLTYANPGYLERDFAPLTLLAHQTAVVAVNPSLPVTTLRELAAYSRARPNTLNYGSASSTLMLAAESLKATVGVDMLHIPDSGLAPSLGALHANDVQLAMLDVSVGAASIKAGRLRGLAVSGRERSPMLPDVPTLAEAGYPDLEIPIWNALYVPAGTPEPVASKIRTAVVRTLEDRDVVDKLVAAGFIPQTTTPEELSALVAKQRAEMAVLVERLGLTPR
jgi:tripartite-type tricarboxylate transporter receptor subunit TctC